MSESPFRRVALVALVYVAGAWLVLGFAEWLRGVLALPRLFQTLLALGVLGGLPLALFFAWRYPTLGTHVPSSDADTSNREDTGRPTRDP